MKNQPTKFTGKRLASLDALRGLNMFWIIGGEKIADAFARLNFPLSRILAAQLNHTKWIGFTFYDLIYPMFIFVTGVSIAYSIENHMKRGQGRAQILLRILRRTFLLFLCGLYLSNSGLSLQGWLTNVRLMGILQRIALCYCGAATLTLFVRKRHQVFIAVMILLGYWLILKFGAVPGYGAGVWYPPEANFANYFDKLFLPGRKYYGTWDVEGLLSTFPALVSCQIGVFAGFWLKKDWRKTGFSSQGASFKTAFLGLTGLLMLGAGLLWGLVLPISKLIWTSSFTLVTGGLSTIVLALFYWLIDVRGFQKWAFPFIVIGLNSIFIYLAVNAVPWNKVFEGLFGWNSRALGQWGGLFSSLVTFFIGWVLLYWMYRKKIFIRF